MNPILFSLGGLKFYSYGLTIFACLVFGVMICYLLLLKIKVKQVSRIDTVLYIVFAGLVGARLTYFLLYYYQFSSFWQMFYFWQNGLVAYGGLFAGSLFALWYLIKHGENIWGWMDAMMIGFFGSYLLGQVIFGDFELILWVSIAWIVLMLIFLIFREKLFHGSVFLVGFLMFCIGQIIFGIMAQINASFSVLQFVFTLTLLFVIINLLVYARPKRKKHFWSPLMARSSARWELLQLKIKQKWLRK